MRSLLILCALVFYMVSNITIAQTIERQVIASVGSISSVDYTIGEVLVTTSNLIVSVGFQQGEVALEDAPLDVTDVSHLLTIYPVPTRDRLTIRGTELSPKNATISLYSLKGVKMNIQVDTQADQLMLDLEGLPSGNYVLTLNDTVNRKIANYKILKIN